MAKAKPFTISKRFEIWVDTTITAPDFEAAVAEGKQMKIDDFIKFKPGTNHNSSDELTGFGVHENY
jgi:hypothetical protein